MGAQCEWCTAETRRLLGDPLNRINEGVKKQRTFAIVSAADTTTDARGFAHLHFCHAAPSSIPSCGHIDDGGQRAAAGPHTSHAVNNRRTVDTVSVHARKVLPLSAHVPNEPDDEQIDRPASTRASSNETNQLTSEHLPVQISGRNARVFGWPSEDFINTSARGPATRSSSWRGLKYAISGEATTVQTARLSFSFLIFVERFAVTTKSATVFAETVRRHGSIWRSTAAENDLI